MEIDVVLATWPNLDQGGSALQGLAELAGGVHQIVGKVKEARDLDQIQTTRRLKQRLELLLAPALWPVAGS